MLLAKRTIEARRLDKLMPPARGAAMLFKGTAELLRTFGRFAAGNEIYLAPYGTAKAQAEDQLVVVKRALSPLPESEAGAVLIVLVVAPPSPCDGDTSI